MTKTGSYVQELFAQTGWHYAEEEMPVLTHKNEVSGEKKQIIESLKEFAQTKQVTPTERARVKFPGGELIIKAPIKQYHTLEEWIEASQLKLHKLSGEYNFPFKLVHETKQSPIKVLFLGDYSKDPKGELCFHAEVRELLLKMISAMKLNSQDFALSLLVKSLGVKEADLSRFCQDSLEIIKEEIIYYKPSLVITLGALSTQTLLGLNERLSVIHGQFFDRLLVTDSGEEFSYKIMPIFHPEFLLINPNMKKTTWDDLQKAMKLLGL